MPKKPDVVWVDLYRVLTRLRKTELLEILGLAFEAVPRKRIAEVFGGHVDLDALGNLRKSISDVTLLKKVKQFHQDSLKGRHRQDFNVNSHNFMEKSEGTHDWIREINKLFEQCCAVGKNHHRRAREAMDLLFDLLHRIDDGEDFVFFADEQGSWQVGVDYDKVFPAYFTVLAATANPADFADRTLELIAMFADYDRDRHLRSARKTADFAQKKELSKYGGGGDRKKRR